MAYLISIIYRNFKIRMSSNDFRILKDGTKIV